MRRILWLFGAAFLMLVVSSCSPVAHVEQAPDVNLSQYKTYAWVDAKSAKNQDGSSPADFARLGVQNSVNEQMQKKGWRLVNKNPDVLLSYDVLVERSVERKDEPVYSQPFARYYYNPYFRRWGTIYYPSRFIGYDSYNVPVREATLTLSMMDARTDKKIWQGWTTQEVNSRLMSKNEIRSGVKSIFKKFGEETNS
jgi:hypothetical protein